MDKTLRNILIIAITIITLIVVGIGGFLIGRMGFMWGNQDRFGFFPMMGFRGTNQNGVRFCPMMELRGIGRDGYWNNPMMGGGRGFGNWQDSQPAEILSIEDAENAVQNYIDSLNAKESLLISEIMIFDNHAYAEVAEEDTGIGAFEVLVDPVTLDVYLEQGASMMWNLKYGHMQGGMMGRRNIGDGVEMPITEEEAVSLANEFFARNNSKLTADDHADQFYGYYTIHTLENDEIVGMLSVNGYSGQIILHNWHGNLIEMTEHEEEVDH